METTVTRHLQHTVQRAVFRGCRGAAKAHGFRHSTPGAAIGALEYGESPHWAPVGSGAPGDGSASVGVPQ